MLPCLSRWASPAGHRRCVPWPCPQGRLHRALPGRPASLRDRIFPSRPSMQGQSSGHAAPIAIPWAAVHLQCIQRNPYSAFGARALQGTKGHSFLSQETAARGIFTPFALRLKTPAIAYSVEKRFQERELSILALPNSGKAQAQKNRLDHIACRLQKPILKTLGA